MCKIDTRLSFLYFTVIFHTRNSDVFCWEKRVWARQETIGYLHWRSELRHCSVQEIFLLIKVGISLFARLYFINISTITNCNYIGLVFQLSVSKNTRRLKEERKSVRVCVCKREREIAWKDFLASVSFHQLRDKKNDRSERLSYSLKVETNLINHKSCISFSRKCSGENCKVNSHRSLFKGTKSAQAGTTCLAIKRDLLKWSDFTSHTN